MSMRESCAAFFISRNENEDADPNAFRDSALEQLHISGSNLTEFGQAEWGGLICEFEVRPFRSFWMLGIIFSFHDMHDLIEDAHAQTSQGKETPNSVRQFVTEFARACTLLQPELALVEFIPMVDILGYVEIDVQDRLEKADLDHFTDGDYPLLYFGESLANELEDWQLDRPRDEVPMRKGRLFYYGSGPDRWDLP